MAPKKTVKRSVKRSPTGHKPLNVVKSAEVRLKRKLAKLYKDAGTVPKEELKTGLKEAQGDLHLMSLWIHWIC
jgi:hypothetical protein